MILENIKTRLELRYHMEDFGYESWGEQTGKNPGSIAFLETENWTSFIVFKVITPKSAVTIDVYPGICCKKEYANLVLRYINKINDTLELGAFKVNNTNNVYLHYVAYFSNGAITKEAFDKLLYDAIDKIDNYKEKLDNLSHGDIEPIFEKLNLAKEEKTDEDASYSNVPMGRMRSKKPWVKFFSKPFLFNDEDDEKEDQADKKEMIKELWHELMDKKSLSEIKQEIEEELEKSSSMETKEKGEDEKEDDFDIDDWFADFDFNLNTDSENKTKGTDEKTSERSSLFDNSLDIDFDSLFDPNSDSNKKDEESNEVTFNNLFPEDLEEEE